MHKLLFFIMLFSMVQSTYAQVVSSITKDDISLEVVSVIMNKPKKEAIDTGYFASEVAEPGMNVLLKISHPSTIKLSVEPTTKLLMLSDNKGNDLLQLSRQTRRAIREYRHVRRDLNFNPDEVEHQGFYLGEAACSKNECLVTLHLDAYPDKDVNFLKVSAEFQLIVAGEAKVEPVPLQLSKAEETITIDNTKVYLSQVGFGERLSDYAYELYDVTTELAIMDIQAIAPNDQPYPNIKKEVKDKIYYGLPAFGYPISYLNISYAPTRLKVLPLNFVMTLSGGLVELQ